jgi:hypothetical protein
MSRQEVDSEISTSDLSYLSALHNHYGLDCVAFWDMDCVNDVLRYHIMTRKGR